MNAIPSKWHGEAEDFSLSSVLKKKTDFQLDIMGSTKETRLARLNLSPGLPACAFLSGQ